MIAAIVPAAGRSERMGRPKLLISIQGETVIGRVVTALREGGADTVVVVAAAGRCRREPGARRRGSQAPGARGRARRAGRPKCAIRSSWGSRPWTGAPPRRRVLLAPGDTPGITRELVARLLHLAAAIAREHCHPVLRRTARASDRTAVVPRRGDPRRCRPTSASMRSSPATRTESLLLPVDDSRVIADLDTPEDLSRWNGGARRTTRSRAVAVPDRSARAGSAELPRVRVRLFALAKERAGRSEIDLELAEAATVAGLRAALAERLPALAPLLRQRLDRRRRGIRRGRPTDPARRADRRDPAGQRRRRSVRPLRSASLRIDRSLARR